MLDYAFYRDTYGGQSIPEAEFPPFARDAAAKLARYKHIYQVSGDAAAENMAACAMADAAYYYDQAANGNLTQSVSVGSVSSATRAAAPDTSPAAQEREFYRCASLYLDIYRGC